MEKAKIKQILLPQLEEKQNLHNNKYYNNYLVFKTNNNGFRGITAQEN